MYTLYLDPLGIQIKIETDCHFVFENLAKDFSLFSTEKPQSPTVIISILYQSPPYHRVPPLDASLHGLGLICYKDKNINYVVYSCDGLLIYNFATEKGELFGKDEFFLYEKAKLTILSRLGELLDHKGLHRLHGFGVTLNQKNLICLLPMEGGKTTTTLNLLKAEPQIKIIADDICFVDHQWTIHPFLLRVGARDPRLVKDIPSEFVNEIGRPYYGIKYFIDSKFFLDRLSKPVRLNHILFGKRSFRQETTIEKISRFKCIGPIFESGVFGLGLPQLLEFFVRGDFRLLSSRIKIILSRVFFCIFLLWKTDTYVMRIGLDKEDTCRKLLEFLRNENSHSC